MTDTQPLLPKATTFEGQLIQASLRRRNSYQGGEGTDRLVQQRDAPGGVRRSYWWYTLCAWHGRALPLGALLIYSAYCVGVAAGLLRFASDAAHARLLGALQMPVQTMGVALFLLVTFRTQSSYERWWEGRKIWDGTTSKCLDIARVATGWVKDAELAARMVRWAAGWAVAAKDHLRCEVDLAPAEPFLRPDELTALAAHAPYMPTYAAARLTECVQEAFARNLLPGPLANSLDNDIRGLSADLAACLRIRSTPMPFAYIVHLRSFLVLWLALLPLYLVPSLQWWALALCLIIGYQVLGFEQIGVEIENPFGRDFNDLPLDTICYLLEVQLKAALDDLHARARPPAASAPGPGANGAASGHP